MKDIKTIYNILPLKKANRETVYKRMSDEVSRRLQMTCAVHGDSTSGVTLTYSIEWAKRLDVTEAKMKLVVIEVYTNHKSPSEQDPQKQRALAALKVLTLTGGTKWYLRNNDPKALEQAENSIKELEAAGVTSPSQEVHGN